MKTNTEAILFLNTLVSNMGIGVLSFDMEGYVTLVNGKALEYLGIAKRVNNIIDTKVISHINIPELSSEVKTCLTRSREDFHLTNIIYNNRHLIINGKKLLDGMLLSISDITENVIAKDEATQSLLLGQEMERRRLAKEIHDGVGPNMSTLKLQIDAVIKKAESEQIVSKLEEVNRAISSIATDIRQISHDLMPSSLIDFGVITALANFATKITDSSEIEVHYQSNIKDGQLSKEYELNIFRIVQELVNNALKYSQCKNIDISLRLDESKIAILVQDDGVGMDIDNITNGIGLQNIKSRVESLHGEIEIDSQKGVGTTFHISLPSNSTIISSQN